MHLHYAVRAFLPHCSVGHWLNYHLHFPIYFLRLSFPFVVHCKQFVYICAAVRLLRHFDTLLFRPPEKKPYVHKPPLFLRRHVKPVYRFCRKIRFVYIENHDLYRTFRVLVGLSKTAKTPLRVLRGAVGQEQNANIRPIRPAGTHHIVRFVFRSFCPAKRRYTFRVFILLRRQSTLRKSQSQTRAQSS